MTDITTLESLRDRQVVLASTAHWRSDILNQLGINHVCHDHNFNEPKYETGNFDKFVEKIAVLKADSLFHKFPDAIIIAADQLCSTGDEILYKSGTSEKAVEQLLTLNGKWHELVCAVAVRHKDKLVSRIDTASLLMRELSEEEIRVYVDKDKPWNCAGSYKIESLGASLFEKIKVEDPTTIIGLPSTKLLSILREMGFSNLL